MAVDEQIQQKIDFYFNVLDRYDHYIELANTKAGNHLTLLGTLLAAVTAVTAWGGDISKLKDLGGSQVILFILYLIFLGFCWRWYSVCYSVLKPALDPAQSRSTIFFVDVSNEDFLNYKTEINGLSEQDLLDDLIGQVHMVSKITKIKFENYLKIQNPVFISVVFGLLILFISVYSKV